MSLSPSIKPVKEVIHKELSIDTDLDSKQLKVYFGQLKHSPILPTDGIIDIRKRHLETLKKQCKANDKTALYWLQGREE